MFFIQCLIILLISVEFAQRKLPSPGFQVEVVLMDYDAAAVPPRPQSETATDKAVENTSAETASQPSPVIVDEAAAVGNSGKNLSGDTKVAGSGGDKSSDQSKHLTNETARLSLESIGSVQSKISKDAAKGSLSDPKVSNSTGNVSEFKAMAADASVFTFGDEEDYESE